MKKIILALAMLTVTSAAKAESFGFLCDGTMLLSSHYSGVATNYNSGEACMNALQNSKNGFICNRSMLISAYYSGIVATFNTSGECLDTIANSK